MIDVNKALRAKPRVPKTPDWFAKLDADNQEALLIIRRKLVSGEAESASIDAYRDVNAQLGRAVCSEGTWRSFVAGRTIPEPEPTRGKAKSNRSK